MHNVSHVPVVTLIAMTFFASCGSSETAELRVSSDSLTPLGPDYVYEGWLIVNGDPVTAGRFSVDADSPLDQTFDLPARDIERASKYVLTIEPAVGDDPAPSSVHLVAGDIVDGQTIARVSDGAALGTDFGDAGGSYILAAPSADPGMGDYNNGIWFLDPSAGPGPSLDLPNLPDGWTYEGWVVTEDGPVSTGRFRSPQGPDSDGAGPDGGPNDGPPFPGQDFVTDSGRIDLVGKTVVISVEPEPDDSPAPFTLKPLIDESVEDVGAMTPQEFSNTAQNPELLVEAL